MNPIKLKKLTNFSYGMREALRTLKSNITFSGDDIKVIMFTSAAPNEGKSSLTLNLARSLTESGKHVLLIDTDMRKSVLAARLRAETEDGEPILGLSHYLSGQEQLDNTIYYTNVKHLYVMFAGPSVPNPTELLEKKYFAKLIEDAREKFDYVLIDTAPLGAAIDAAIVARHCDGTILVVAQRVESSKRILEAKNQIEASGGKILGVVLNKVVLGKVGYNKYYGSYYGKYYGDSKDKDSKSIKAKKKESREKARLQKKKRKLADKQLKEAEKAKKKDAKAQAKKDKAKK